MAQYELGIGRGRWRDTRTVGEGGVVDCGRWARRIEVAIWVAIEAVEAVDEVDALDVDARDISVATDMLFGLEEFGRRDVVNVVGGREGRERARLGL